MQMNQKNELFISVVQLAYRGTSVPIRLRLVDSLFHCEIYCTFDIFQKVVFGALHKRSKFANFCHDLIQNHLS